MPAKRSILVVDDDESIREMLAERLAEDHGFAVRTAVTLAAADMAINDEASHFEAVILDLGMPDGNGFDYCTKLRRQGHNMPVIILTGSHGEEDVVRGLSSGANDYIAKPFRFNALLPGFGHSCANSTAAKMQRFRLARSSSVHRGSCYRTRPLDDASR